MAAGTMGQKKKKGDRIMGIDKRYTDEKEDKAFEELEERLK